MDPDSLFSHFLSESFNKASLRSGAFVVLFTKQTVPRLLASSALRLTLEAKESSFEKLIRGNYLKIKNSQIVWTLNFRA